MRINRIINLFFGLLFVAFLFPVLINVLMTLKRGNEPLDKYSNKNSIELMKKFRQEQQDDIETKTPVTSNSNDTPSMATAAKLESEISSRLVYLEHRVKYAEMIAAQRKEEIFKLLTEIRNLSNTIYKNGTKNRLENDVISGEDVMFPMNQEMIHRPSLMSLLTHLSPSSLLNPAFRIASQTISNPRRYVFGIPTVKRIVESYLISTVRDLFQNLSEIERQQSLFVIFIAEMDMEFVRNTANSLTANFQKEIDSGLLEIISPPVNYYPDFSKLKSTIGDPVERTQWRTKQNYDFAYLMMYCQSKGLFYIQLEDDIISKPNYVYKISNFIVKINQKKPDWIILDFCALGFIGKLFRTTDLSKLILFFLIFQNDKPVDWLLDHYIQNKVCRFDKPTKHCKSSKESVWIVRKPSLFQHIGVHSSLKGKIQKLRDKGFGKIKLFKPHLDNPPAEVFTTLTNYQNYKLSDTYAGKTFFWSFTPRKGDIILFKFKPSVALEHCLIRTGNVEHPFDTLFNATLQAKSEVDQNSANDFVNLGYFNPLTGSIDIDIKNELNPIKELRIHIDANSTNWLIISEKLSHQPKYRLL